MSAENNKKIKIVYLVDFLRTIQAGTEKQLSHLLDYIPGKDFDVQVVSLQNSPFLEREAANRFPDVRFHTQNAKADISQSLISLIHLFNFLRKDKPDIVHTFFPMSNSLGIMIARLAGTRTLISSRRDMGFNLSGKDVILLKIANRFVSRIITNAKKIQEHTVQSEGVNIIKTIVIPNGISLNGYNISKNRWLPEKPIIGIVANMNRKVKRVDLFVSAASIVHQAFPNAEFWVFGDGPLRLQLERMASELSLGTSIRFFGRITNVKEYLSQMSIGVNCSDSEGLSNAIMEYMGAGLPVIATDAGGNPELVKHKLTGLLVPPNDRTALAHAILKLLHDQNKAELMGIRGHEVMESDFSIENMFQRTTDLYLSLYAENKRLS